MPIPIVIDRNDETCEDDLVLFPGMRTNVSFAVHDEGQLAVDVMETDTEIILTSAIAGVRPDDLEVSVHHDMLTVRGTRSGASQEGDGAYLVRECHWGAFSRSVILPSEVDADRISAELKNGVLTVRMPKMRRSRKIAILT